ncbi:hypothetical protein ACFL47_07425 [Candidatus Latescibacterota bacterium]
MIVLLYILLAVAGILFLAVMMPIRIRLGTSGSTDRSFSVETRALFFSGLAGFGVNYDVGTFMLTFFMGTKCLFTIDLTRLISISSRFRGERKKKTPKFKIEKPEKEKKKQPLKIYLKLAREGLSVLKWIIREFAGVIGFDHITSEITLGLGRPDITGLISGFLIGINGMLPDRYEIIPQWDFTREVLRGHVTFDITVRGYIFWVKLVTRVPMELFRKRKRLFFWINTFRGDNSLQEV